MTTTELKRVANTLRQDIISMLVASKSGHPGGSLSAADIVSTLFFHEMRIKPEDPRWADRDRFVLSKGHAAPVLYAALAEKGYFPKELPPPFETIGNGADKISVDKNISI